MLLPRPSRSPISLSSCLLVYVYRTAVNVASPSLCITLQVRIARPNDRRSPPANLLKTHRGWHSPWNVGVQQEVWHMVCPWSCSIFFGIWTSLPALRGRPEPLSQSQFPSWHRFPVRHRTTLTVYSGRRVPAQFSCLTSSQARSSSQMWRADGGIMLFSLEPQSRPALGLTKSDIQ